MGNRLTEKTLRGLSVPADKRHVEVSDDLLKGFGVIVMRSGRRTFFCRFSRNGSRRRVTIGLWPEMTLGEARERARAVMLERPATPPREILTFGELASLYVERHARIRKKASSIREDERILKKNLEPAWGELRAGEIDVRQAANLFSEIAGSGAQ